MNYEPNTIKWKPGDIVIHDADEKSEKMLMTDRGDLYHGLWCAEVRRANAAENALRDLLPVFDNESTQTLARVYAKEIATATALLSPTSQKET